MTKEEYHDIMKNYQAPSNFGKWLANFEKLLDVEGNSKKHPSYYYLTMNYPQNDVFLKYNDSIIGMIKEVDLTSLLTEEMIEILQDTGYCELENRHGKAIESYLKTGVYKLNKPTIVVGKNQ